MHLKKRQGSVYVVVVGVFLVISLFTAFMATELNQTIYQMHAHSLQMRAYYLNLEAEETTAAVLLKDENKLLNGLVYPKTDRMEHLENGHVIGESVITLRQEKHKYYDVQEDWVVAYVETTIKDDRVTNRGSDFHYKGTVMILKKNPIVQLYNVSPESI